MHSWQAWGLKIHHTSSDYAYTILCPWQLGWWCCTRCLSMAAFTAFNIYWFVDINKFIEPMTSCHHQSLSYLLLQSFNAGHLILSDQSLYKVMKMFAVLLIRQCKVTFCSRNSLDPPSFNCSWDNIWQLGSDLVAPLVQTPSWLQSIKKRSMLLLRLKMEDLFFLLTQF